MERGVGWLDLVGRQAHMPLSPSPFLLALTLIDQMGNENALSVPNRNIKGEREREELTKKEALATRDRRGK